jgi:putative transcriptional regulator
MLRFLLAERLRDLNALERTERTWDDVARETGIHRSTLASLAGNTRLTATSTRVVETLCRYFDCPASGEGGLFELIPMQLQGPFQMDWLYGPEEHQRFLREYATRRRQPRRERR